MYFALRFAVLVRHDGPRAGIVEWTQEAGKHFSSRYKLSDVPVEPGRAKDEDAASAGDLLYVENIPFGESTSEPALGTDSVDDNKCVDANNNAKEEPETE